MRRVLDFAFSALGCVLLLPMFVAVIAAIKMDDAGPVFYRAQRVGLNGKVFLALKLRTMVVNADKCGFRVTSADDRRVTRIGRLLRRFKLDEFPQLINVLRGEMALVGPRPEDPRYTAMYSENQRRILSIRPGITSPASLCFKDEASLLVGPGSEEKYVTEIFPKKLVIDLEYFEHNTVWSDFGVIVRTIKSIFR